MLLLQGTTNFQRHATFRTAELHIRSKSTQQKEREVVADGVVRE